MPVARRKHLRHNELDDDESLVFSEPDDECWGIQDEPGLERVVQRGHEDGSIDAGLPADWVQSLIWSQLYAAWSYLGERPAVSRHDVLALLTRTIANALRPGAPR